MLVTYRGQGNLAAVSVLGFLEYPQHPQFSILIHKRTINEGGILLLCKRLQDYAWLPDFTGLYSLHGLHNQCLGQQEPLHVATPQGVCLRLPLGVLQASTEIQQ